MAEVFSKCGMRCDLCLLWRPNVQQNDRREEICRVFAKTMPGYHPDPHTVICDGCGCEKADAVLFDPSCKARKCAMEKGLTHCGYCDAYPCKIFPAEPTAEQLAQSIGVEKKWTWEDEKLMEAYNCKKNMDAFREEGSQDEKDRRSVAGHDGL